MKLGSCIHLEELSLLYETKKLFLNMSYFFRVIFVSPAKQKRDICTAFPASSLSSAAAAAA